MLVEEAVDEEEDEDFLFGDRMSSIRVPSVGWFSWSLYSSWPSDIMSSVWYSREEGGLLSSSTSEWYD